MSYHYLSLLFLALAGMAMAIYIIVGEREKRRSKGKVERGVLVRNTPNNDKDFGEYAQWAGKVKIMVDGEDVTIEFTDYELAKHLKRSKENPEDNL